MQALLGEHFLQYSRRWRATEKPPQGVPERPLEASRKGPEGSREAPGRLPGEIREPRWLLEASWSRLGGLLGASWAVLGAS